VNARWRQITRALLMLPFRPDRLAHAAIVTPAPLCAAVGAVTWTLAITLPLLGGGMHMPYSTWGHHLHDTLAFAPVLLLVIAPVAVPLVFLIQGSAGGNDEGDVLARTVVLSAVPWIAPLLLRLPFQVCARASRPPLDSRGVLPPHVSTKISIGVSLQSVSKPHSSEPYQAMYGSRRDAPQSLELLELPTLAPYGATIPSPRAPRMVLAELTILILLRSAARQFH
jgi:hypothetical protein